MEEVDFDRLQFFLAGEEIAPRLCELLLGRVQSIYVRPVGVRSALPPKLPASAILPVGYTEGEAMLPPTPRSYDGYRLLREYFMLPERFLFFELNGLKQALPNPPGNQLDIIITFKTRETR